MKKLMRNMAFIKFAKGVLKQIVCYFVSCQQAFVIPSNLRDFPVSLRIWARKDYIMEESPVKMCEIEFSQEIIILKYQF